MGVQVELPSEEAVLAFSPNPSLISAIDCRGVIITAPGGKVSGVDFVSRFFAPRFGIPEVRLGVKGLGWMEAQTFESRM